MERYLIYRRNSSTEFEYLGSARFKETAIAFCSGVSNCLVVLDNGSIFKTIVYEK